jgi:hypothetical protein
MEDSLVVAVRAAAGSLPEVAGRFGLPATTVWRIKHGIAGSHVPYTHTVLPPGERPPGRGLKLSEEQIARIKADRRRDRDASEELAAQCGVTSSRVREIWRERDFMAARAAHEASASERDAEVVAGSVGEVQPHADVPLRDSH